MSVHNEEEGVARAVESILQQTWKDFEFIIVDDGSTDSSAAIVERFAEQDRRIRFIRQTNAGLTRALIRGCRHARGRYIARQDADDWSHPSRLERQVAVLERDNRVGFVSCFTRYVDPFGNMLTTIRRPVESEIATRALLYERQGPPAHGSVMFRRDLYENVGGYRPAFYFGQDSDLWLRMAQEAAIAYVPDVLYVPTRDAESVSGKWRPLQRRFGELGLLCHRARCERRSEAPFLREAEALTEAIREGQHGARCSRRMSADAWYHVGCLALAGNRRVARRYFRTAVRYCPWHAKAWIRLGQSFLPGHRADAEASAHGQDSK